MSHYALSITYHFGRLFFFMQKWRNFLIDKKYLRLNQEMKAYIDPIRKRFFGHSEEHVLGVVSTGI